MEIAESGRVSSEKSDNLFTFEMYVNSVHGVAVKCSIPAVAYRLLDFPTLLIYQTSLANVDKIRDRIRPQGFAGHEDDVLPVDEPFERLKNNDGSFSFNKGKSSLFSMDFAKLYSLLSTIPVYVMLLDVCEPKSKLLGSCSISLKTAVDQLKGHVQHSGFVVPASYKKTVHLNVFNLMGTVIGQLDITYSLYSYGNSLNNHVQKPGLGGIQMYYDRRADDEKPREGADGDVLKSEKLAEKIRNIDKATETIPYYTPRVNALEESPNNIEKAVLPKGQKSLNDEEVNCCTGVKTTDSPKNEKKMDSSTEYDIEMGSFCPPPLFFKSTKEVGCLQPQSDLIPNIQNTKVTSAPQNLDPFIDNLTSLKDKQSHVYQTDVVTGNDNVYHEIVKQVDASKSNAKSTITQQNINAFEKRNENIPGLPRQEQSTGESISTVLSSLNSLPLLQGILKEIVNFSRQGNSQQPSNTKTAPKTELSDLNGQLLHELEQQKGSVVTEKNLNAVRRGSILNTVIRKVKLDEHEETRKKPANEIGKLTKRKAPKKLKFKTTRTQQMRCALNSGAGKLEKKRLSNPKDTLVIENKKNLNQRFMPHLSHDEPRVPVSKKQANKLQNNYDDEQVHLYSARYKNRRESERSSSDSDGGDNRRIDGMKSKSPVSLEIHLPSAAGTAELEFAMEASSQENANLMSSSFGHSGIYSPPPLQRKWGANQDLSKIDASPGPEDDDSQTGADSTSRMSELEKLADESSHNTSASNRTPVASERRKLYSGEDGEVWGRKSVVTDGYSTDNFDNVSESSRSSVASYESRSYEEKSSPPDSLNSSRPSKYASKSSEKVGSDIRSLTDSAGSYKSYRSDRDLSHSNRSVTGSLKSGSSRNIDTSDKRQIDRSISRTTASDTVGSDRKSRNDSLRLHRSVSSNADSRISHASQELNSAKLDSKSRDDSQRSARLDTTNAMGNVPRKTVPDLSQPVASVYSPTTSRSLRNKIQLSHQSNDDITRSIDLSNLSLNTDSEYDSIDMDDIDRELESPVNKRKNSSRAS